MDQLKAALEKMADIKIYHVFLALELMMENNKLLNQYKNNNLEKPQLYSGRQKIINNIKKRGGAWGI